MSSASITHDKTRRIGTGLTWSRPNAFQGGGGQKNAGSQRSARSVAAASARRARPAWHQADLPDAAERARNEVIHGAQGNRNPFIDQPEWGTATLFTSARPASCQLPN